MAQGHVREGPEWLHLASVMKKERHSLVPRAPLATLYCLGFLYHWSSGRGRARQTADQLQMEILALELRSLSVRAVSQHPRACQAWTLMTLRFWFALAQGS